MLQRLNPFSRFLPATSGSKPFAPQRYIPPVRDNARLLVSDELQRATKSISYSQMVQDFINNGGGANPLYTEEQVEAAYKTSVYLFATMRRVANLFSDLKIVGEFKQDTEWERLPEGNALNRVFDEAGAKFNFELMMFYMLYGQTLIYKRKTRRAIYAWHQGSPIFNFLQGAIAGVHVIPNANWTMREDTYTGEVLGFDLNVLDVAVGDRRTLERGEVVFWHDFDPRYINGAVSMASLAINNAISNAAIARWAAHYFMSGAMPLLLISTEDTPNVMAPTDNEKYKSFVERAWQGMFGRFSLRAVWTDRKLSVQEAGIDADKVQAPEINADALRAIASVFQLAPDLIVPPEGGSQSRHKELIEDAYRTAVIPLGKQLLTALNEDFGFIGTNVRLVIDEDAIQALEAGRQEAAQTEVSIFQTGGMKHAELQSRLNLEAIPELENFIMFNNELKSIERVLREDKFVSDKILTMAQQAWDSDGILRSEYRSFLGLKTPIKMHDGFKTEVTTQGMDTGGGSPFGGGGAPGGNTPPALPPPAPTTPPPASTDDARQIPGTDSALAAEADEADASDEPTTVNVASSPQSEQPADKQAELTIETEAEESEPKPPAFEFPQGTAITELSETPAPPQTGTIVPNSVYVVLDVADDSLLYLMRDGVAELLGDAPMQWEVPERWHVTLTHLSDVSEDKLQAALLLLPEMLSRLPLRVTSTVTFDTPEGTCVALAIDDDESLAQLQSAVCKAFEAQGGGVDEFSKPGAFTPHITLGHLPAGSYVLPLDATCIVEPSRLIVSRPEYEIVYEVPFGRPVLPDESAEEQPVQSVTLPDDDAAIETLLVDTYAARFKMRALVKAWAETGIAPETTGGVVEAITSALAGGQDKQTVFASALQAVESGLFDDQAHKEENPLVAKSAQKTPADELVAWERFTLKNGVTKATTRFEINSLPLNIETTVKTALLDAADDRGRIKRVFIDARKTLADQTDVADMNEDILAEWAERMKEAGLDDLLPKESDESEENNLQSE